MVKSNLKNKKPPRHTSVDSEKRVTFPTLSMTNANQGQSSKGDAEAPEATVMATVMATTADTLPKPASSKQRPTSAKHSMAKKGGKVGRDGKEQKKTEETK